jgi:hypothetical protein
MHFLLCGFALIIGTTQSCRRHTRNPPFGIGVSTDDLVRSTQVKCRGSGTCLPKDAAAYDIKFMDQSLRVLMALRGV